MTTWRAPLAAAACALITAACASNTSTTTSSSAASSTSSSTVSQDVAADKALAQAALLKLSDFPTGWTSLPSTSNQGSPAVEKQLISCLHVSPQFLDSNNPTNVDSPDFSDPNNNTASNSVTYGASASTVHSQFAVLTSTAFAPCVQQAVKTEIAYALQHPSNPSDTVPSGLTFGSPTVAQMSFPTLGDQTVAYRVTVPIMYQGLSPDAYFDFVAIQKGRAVAVMTFEGAVTPFDSSMAEQLSTLTVGRLADT
jgi:hypothetical protein